MDYEIERSAECFTATGRQFVPGEEFYSVLIAGAPKSKRCDYSREAWQGPPPGTTAGGSCRTPDEHARRRPSTPNDVLLNFFDELAEQPDKQDMGAERCPPCSCSPTRRVMRMEEEQRDEVGQERLMLYCPRARCPVRSARAGPPSATGRGDPAGVGEVAGEMRGKYLVLSS